MKPTITQKHPYIFSILAGLLCTFFTAIGMAISQIIKLDTYATYLTASLFLIISVLVGLLIMKKSRFALKDYGLRKNEEKSFKKVWFYIPLIIIEIIPVIIYGFLPELTLTQFLIIALFTIAVGFNEEFYFRGIAYKLLEEKGRKKAIIGSSVIFGVLHLVNALNGKNALYLILQMFFAFLVGFVLSEIVSITKSLWILILWHGTHDFISMTTEETLDQKALILLAIQVFLLLVYSVGLWRNIKAPQQNVSFTDFTNAENA